ncbi:MAG: redoxin domain-containing protein [Chitinophagaceae bacterium]|nr:redoxin domain-containing protein [Chitinophagaceae bacterium]
MNKISIFVFGLLVSIGVIAQSPIDTIPPYKKNPTIPEFSILQTDSSWYTKKDIKPYDYTAIIYFSPDCGHCQHEAKQIVNNIDSLKNILFIWVSYRDFNDIKKFYHHYTLDMYPNMIMGRDPKYAIPSFYQVRYTPFVALYDKKQQLVTTWDMGVEIPELLEFIRKK